MQTLDKAQNQTVLRFYRQEKDALLPLWSGRGCEQTLEKITIKPVRGINGTLFDLEGTAWDKWHSTVTCQDTAAPSMENIHPNDNIWVECLMPLSQWVQGAKEIILKYPAVGHKAIFQPSTQQDSITVKVNTTGHVHTVHDSAQAPYTGWITYHPCLYMKILGYTMHYHPEEGTQWKITLEEI